LPGGGEAALWDPPAQLHMMRDGRCELILLEGGAHQVTKLAEMVLAVEDYEHLTTAACHPAQLAHSSARIWDVVEHVHGQGKPADFITQRESGGVPRDQDGGRCPAAGGVEHPDRKVHA